MKHMMIHIQVGGTILSFTTNARAVYERTCPWLEDHTFRTENPFQIFCKPSHRVMYCKYQVNRPVSHKSFSFTSK